MPNTKNTNAGTVALAALVGGAAGALVSLLFAPKSGKELRQDIQNKAAGIIEQVEDTTLQRAEAIKQRSIDLADKGKKLKSDIQLFIQDLRLKKPDYIDVTQTPPAEPWSQDNSTANSTESVPTDVPPYEERPTV